MSKLKVGSLTLIVNGYYNNGRPYFQRAVQGDWANAFIGSCG